MRGRVAHIQRLGRAVATALLLVASAPSVAAEPPQHVPQVDFAAEAKAAAERDAARAATGAPGPAADIRRREQLLHMRSSEWTAEFRQRSFEWHLLSTKIIFFLVVFIVCFGLFITYLQFSRDYSDSAYAKPPPTPVDGTEAAAVSPAAPAAARPVTSMKLGPGGLELSSQIIGLAVLAFSLGFFYLYVKDVYPIHETSLAPEPPAAAATPK